MIGDVHTSLYKSSRGWFEVSVFVENGSLWVLFMRQFEQGKYLLIESKIGKETLETIVFKTERDGWPSRLCHEVMSVFGVGEAKFEDRKVDGTSHSYSSFRILPSSNRAPY